MLQRARLGLGLTVFVGVKLEGHADARADAFQDAVRAMPEVVAFHMVSGEADYLLEVVVPDLDHYRRFLLEKLLELPIIKEVRSNIAIETLKAAAPLPLDHLGLPGGRARTSGARAGLARRIVSPSRRRGDASGRCPEALD
jgi:Lrp/AsnC family transcriptional regulator, leucine-responsive regulatory protein